MGPNAYKIFPMKEKPSPEEVRMDRQFRRFAKLGDLAGCPLRRHAVTPGAPPIVLFLGNHSSGKSSFINYLLDPPPVQDTGVAPTDDGFTVLVYGETEKDVNGPAALDALPADFAALRSLGPDFLRHLRVKIRPRPILRRITLLDSPGMIGSATDSAARDYPFFPAVRHAAEIADLVLFLFDPEKPGTTGETVSALGECFAGLEFKLRILMNKCDTFDSMFDFARAYGSLCWNLAHVLPVKDLPTVFTTFLPQSESRRNPVLSLADFDRHRGELVSQVSNAGQSRTDNLVDSLQKDLRALELQLRLLLRARRSQWCARVGSVLGAAVLAALVGLGGYFALSRWVFKVAEGAAWYSSRGLLDIGISAAVALGFGAAFHLAVRYGARRRLRDLLRNPDPFFEEVCAEDLARPSESAPLRQTWRTVRPLFLRQMSVRSSAFHFLFPWHIGRVRRAMKAAR